MKSLILSAFLFLILKIFFSLIAAEVFFQGLSNEGLMVARITAIFSIIFSTTFNCLFINCILLVIWYGSNLFIHDLELDMFIPAFHIFFIILITAEIFKFGFIWIFLIDEMTNIDASSLEFSHEIELTNFHRYSRVVDIFSIVFSVFLFGVKLKQKLVPKLIISFFFLIIFFVASLL
jgi:hypothetical protein